VRGRLFGGLVEPGEGWKTPAGAGTTPRRNLTGRRSTEDPRGCGDDRVGQTRPRHPAGRPPRVRGRRLHEFHLRFGERKTPAGAGTTPAAAVAGAVGQEDPRGCGDDHHRPALVRPASGRPPRVRGRPGLGGVDRRDVGKTPAGAGTTPPGPPGTSGGAEDPRGCGDDCRFRPWPSITGGRPPRVRGRHPRGVRCPRRTRKTPAGAGTTSPGSPTTASTTEDPRGCGDDSKGIMQMIDPTWKTPAGAGTTERWPGNLGPSEEDPRGCGDDARATRSAVATPGRPPRVRGRLDPIRQRADDDRKTPAGAGTTTSRTTTTRAAAEDPRGCGDDKARAATDNGQRGRPPRVRGRLQEPRRTRP